MLLTVSHENNEHLSINCTDVHTSYLNIIIVVYYHIMGVGVGGWG
jgi:hypothetical protein